MNKNSALPNIKKSKLTEQIYQHLRELIISGQWPTGYKIPSETELAEQFGVSRMSVRSALQRLESLGLVEIRAGHCSIVTEFSLKDYLSQIGDLLLRDSSVSEIIQFRFAYEMAAIRMAIRNASQDGMAELRRYYDDMVFKMGGEDMAQRMESVYSFYHYICMLSGNSLFVRLDEALKMNILTSNEVENMQYKSRRDYVGIIGTLVSAIESRDIEKATSIFGEIVDTSLRHQEEKDKATVV